MRVTGSRIKGGLRSCTKSPLARTSPSWKPGKPKYATHTDYPDKTYPTSEVIRPPYWLSNILLVSFTLLLHSPSSKYHLVYAPLRLHHAPLPPGELERNSALWPFEKQGIQSSPINPHPAISPALKYFLPTNLPVVRSILAYKRASQC